MMMMMMGNFDMCVMWLEKIKKIWWILKKTFSLPTDSTVPQNCILQINREMSSLSRILLQKKKIYYRWIWGIKGGK